MANGKTKVGPCWRSFIQSELSRGSHKSPDRVRNIGYLLGYHYISYLINASIYLVKGGRLGLLSSVLFNSCRPSFRHTGAMFLDFVFLTRLGVMGTTRQFALNKTPPARPNLGFTICHLSLFPWVSRTQGSSYFNPPGPVLL